MSSDNYEPTLASAIIISDSCIREQGTSKMSYIGSFQIFNAPKFPFVAPPFMVTPVISNITPKEGEHVHVSLRVENPKNGLVVCSAAVEIGFQAAASKNDMFEVPIPVGRAIFGEPGTYRIVVLVNNEQVGTRDVAVNSVSGKQISQL